MSFKDKYLKYKEKYFNIKYENLKGGYIPDSIIGKEMILNASQILKYNIYCDKNIPNGIYNSLDSKYSNYSFKLRSCKEDYHGYFYLTIYKKNINPHALLPIMNNNLIILNIKYTGNILPIYVNNYDYVFNLKNIIYKKTGMLPIQQQLIFNYITLEDNNVIASYNIGNNDFITLLNKQSMTLYPNITTGIFQNQPVSVFSKFPKKKSYSSSSSSSSSSSDGRYRNRKSIKSNSSKSNSNSSNDKPPSESVSEIKSNEESLIKTNYNLWFILNEKDSFYYWQEYNNDKIEKVYQEYLDTLKSIKSSVITTIEPKILVDFAKMKLITVNIDNTNIKRKIKRIFLEKLKIFNNLNWFFEDNKKWNKLDNSNKIEEIYQIYISFKTYFSKNSIFYLSDDTFIDFKNMVIIIKSIKKNIKRE
jgi:hypothetical protein